MEIWRLVCQIQKGIGSFLLRREPWESVVVAVQYGSKSSQSWRATRERAGVYGNKGCPRHDDRRDNFIDVAIEATKAPGLGFGKKLVGHVEGTQSHKDVVLLTISDDTAATAMRRDGRTWRGAICLESQQHCHGTLLFLNTFLAQVFGAPWIFNATSDRPLSARSRRFCAPTCVNI